MAKKRKGRGSVKAPWQHPRSDGGAVIGRGDGTGARGPGAGAPRPPSPGANGAGYQTQFMGGGERTQLHAGAPLPSVETLVPEYEEMRRKLEEFRRKPNHWDTHGSGGGHRTDREIRTQQRGLWDDHGGSATMSSGGIWVTSGGGGARTFPIPAFEFQKTGMPRVWAGRNPLAAADVDALVKVGVTHILDLREPAEWTAPRLGEAALARIAEVGIIRLSVPIRDTFEASAPELDRAVAFVAEALAGDPGAQVYLHCRAGKGRTGMVLLAYCARHLEGAVGKADRRLWRDYRPYAPLGNQEAAVRRWHTAWVGGGQLAPAGGVPSDGVLLACDECNVALVVHHAVVGYTCRACWTAALFPPPGPGAARAA